MAHVDLVDLQAAY